MTTYFRLIIFQARLDIKILEIEEKLLDQIDSDKALLKSFFGEK